MNIRPKSASSTGPVTKQPTQHKPTVGSKKIDMGAAANFGKQSSVSSNAAGIHSPTHRDTPGEGNNDLIGYSPINNNNMGISSSHESNNTNTTTTNNNNAIDSLFKTCSPKSEKTLNSAAIINDDLDDFNPRAAEQQQNEFGDFASAFGSVAAEPPSASLGGITSSTNDDFADFSAFQGSSTTSNSTTLTSSMGGLEGNLLTAATPANDSFDLFNSSPAVNNTTNATTTSLGATTATDLLAGLGDLSIHQSMPMGKFVLILATRIFSYLSSLSVNFVHLLRITKMPCFYYISFIRDVKE